MRKIRHAQLVVAALAIVLTACGGGGKAVRTQVGSAPSTTELATSTTAPVEGSTTTAGAGTGGVGGAPPAPTTTIAGRGAGAAGAPVIAEDPALGVVLTLASSKSEVGAKETATFTLTIENRSAKHIRYDRGLQNISLLGPTGTVWTPSCGAAGTAVIEPATLAPGAKLDMSATYPHADAKVAQGCRPPAGTYELQGSFAGCPRDTADPGPDCTEQSIAEVKQGFRQT